MADGKIDFTKDVGDTLSPQQRLQELQAEIDKLEAEREKLAADFKARTDALEQRREELIREVDVFKNDVVNSMKSRLGVSADKASEGEYGDIVVRVPASWVHPLKTPDKNTNRPQVVVNLPSEDKDWKSPNVGTVFMDEMRTSRRDKQMLLDFSDRTGSDKFRYQEHRGTPSEDGGKRVGASRIRMVPAAEMADIVLARSNKKPHFVSDREAHIDAKAAEMMASAEAPAVSSVVPEDVREKSAPAPEMDAPVVEGIDADRDVTPFE